MSFPPLPSMIHDAVLGLVDRPMRSRRVLAPADGRG